MRVRKTVCLGVLCWVSLASGNEPSAADKEAARALMDRGDAAAQTEDHLAALKAYQDAHAIMNVPTTGIEVVETLVELRRLVEARDVALAVARIPVQPREPKPFAEARAEASALAEQLGKRIPRVEISIVNAPQGSEVSVSIDGVAIPPAALSVPRPLDPGEHTLVALAGGKQTTASVNLAEGAHEQVKLEFVSDATARPAQQPPAPAAPSEPEQSGGLGTQRTLAIVVAGVGVVGIGVGSFLGLDAKAQFNEAKERCTAGTSGCDAQASSMSEDAKSQADLATIVFGVGAAALIGGGVLWLTAPDPTPEKTAGLRWVPRVGSGRAELGLRGTF